MIRQRVLPYAVDEVLNVSINPAVELKHLIADIQERTNRGAGVPDKNGCTRTNKVILAYYENNLEKLHQALIIMEQKITDTKSPLKKTVSLIAITPIVRFSDKCLEKYHLCKVDGLDDKYFTNFFQEPIVFGMDIFKSFIVDECGFSFKKESDNYWKKPENASVILEKLESVGKINKSKLRAPQ